MATFKERLKQVRKERNLKQSELANEIGVSMYTVSMWERGLQNPTFANLDALSDVLKVNLGYLLGSSDDQALPAEPGDEDLAHWCNDDEKVLLEEVFSRMTKLSESSMRIVKAAVNQAYKEDKYHNSLQEGYDLKVSDKKLTDEDSDTEVSE